MVSSITVDELVSTLAAIPEADFGPERVRTALGSVSIAEASLEKYVHWIPRRYTRNLVHRDETFELILLCWDLACASPVHNHSAQDCWMHVHQGSLCLEEYQLEDASKKGLVGNAIGVKRTARIAQAGRGTVDYRGGAHEIHRVVNCRSFKSRAISLHVYSRPFDRCIVYDPRHRVASYKELSYDTVHGAPMGEQAAAPSLGG